MWKEIKATSDLKPCLQFFCARDFCNALNQGFFISYDATGNNMSIYDPDTLEKTQIDQQGANHLQITQQNIYLSLSNTLMRLNKKSLVFEELCKTDLDNIGLYNEDYATAGTIVRDKKNRRKIISQKSEIISLNGCDVIYTWERVKFNTSVIKKNVVIFKDTKKNQLIRLDYNGSEVWKFKFNDNFWGGRRYTQLVDDILVIRLEFNDEFDHLDHNHLLGLDIYTGKVKWSLKGKNIFRWYQFDGENKKLFAVDGFDNVIYQVIDPLTGTIEIEKNLSETHKNIKVNCHNVFFAEDNYLYFSSNTRSPIEDSELDYNYLQPQVGAINTQTQELEYLVDIPIDMKTISRSSNALNSPPIVHENRMYIMDNENYLHILEK